MVVVRWLIYLDWDSFLDLTVNARNFGWGILFVRNPFWPVRLTEQLFGVDKFSLIENRFSTKIALSTAVWYPHKLIIAANDMVQT